MGCACGPSFETRGFRRAPQHEALEKSRTINSPATERVDVLDVLRQRRPAPGLAAVLRAEHLAVARGDVDLLLVRRMQADRHQGAVRLHLVEALPRLAD